MAANHPDEHGVIFLTASLAECNGIPYEYQDKLMRDEFNPDKYHAIWKGQKKGRRDYIVTQGTREIHVCARSKPNKPYTYYGKIKNETIQMMYEGNHAISDPDAYYFELETEHITTPFKTVLAGNLPPQAQAVQSLGFQFTPACCGIYKVWV
tara:strand:- start:200 stop:655 length:456 start_codon:yes stop_codon:yes gene_type:complete